MCCMKCLHWFELFTTTVCYLEFNSVLYKAGTVCYPEPASGTYRVKTEWFRECESPPKDSTKTTLAVQTIPRDTFFKPLFIKLLKVFIMALVVHFPCLGSHPNSLFCCQWVHDWLEGRTYKEMFPAVAQLHNLLPLLLKKSLWPCRPLQVMRFIFRNQHSILIK